MALTDLSDTTFLVCFILLLGFGVLTFIFVCTNVLCPISPAEQILGTNFGGVVPGRASAPNPHWSVGSCWTFFFAVLLQGCALALIVIGVLLDTWSTVTEFQDVYGASPAYNHTIDGKFGTLRYRTDGGYEETYASVCDTRDTTPCLVFRSAGAIALGLSCIAALSMVVLLLKSLGVACCSSCVRVREWEYRLAVLQPTLLFFASLFWALPGHFDLTRFYKYKDNGYYTLSFSWSLGISWIFIVISFGVSLVVSRFHRLAIGHSTSGAAVKLHMPERSASLQMNPLAYPQDQYAAQQQQQQYWHDQQMEHAQQHTGQHFVVGDAYRV